MLLARGSLDQMKTKSLLLRTTAPPLPRRMSGRSLDWWGTTTGSYHTLHQLLFHSLISQRGIVYSITSASSLLPSDPLLPFEHLIPVFQMKKATLPEVQVTLQDTVHRGKPYNKGSVRYKQITQKLATFVASSNVSNRIMEDEEFHALLAQLDERYHVPGRTVINHELLIELKSKITLKLQNTRKISMCADIWSKKGMTTSYLGLSAHFFTQSDHRRHTVTLVVRQLPSPHTAERIEELVCEIIKEWEIPENKISAIITDNGSNMIKAFRDWLQKIQKDDEDEEENEELLIDLLTGSPEEVEQVLVKTRKKRVVIILDLAVIKCRRKLKTLKGKR